jgi:hypothetical protein
VLLTGTLKERIELAVRVVDQLIDLRLQFAPPFSGPGFGV